MTACTIATLRLRSVFCRRIASPAIRFWCCLPRWRIGLDRSGRLGSAAQAEELVEKVTQCSAPFGRGSVSGCEHRSPILSRDQRERFFAFFSYQGGTDFSLC